MPWFWVLVIVVLGGCATMDKPTATLPEKERDEVECRRDAEQGTPQHMLLRNLQVQELLVKCLESRGWGKQ